ncbi:MAG: A/G-specific adenine glycosylase [Bacteriovoracaceae bacterium]|jgi:A/G-specific adenine glycosylase|nr:A/G-specific adenine glycosylase [Bacteriovoracaceae bacterium]
MFKKMIKWSISEFPDFPWRLRRNLYGTLVSEIMLQQTTVQTVLNHFNRFLDLYPDIQSLAVSSEDDIIKAWKGLGYYRRARNLRAAAIDIQDKFQGKIPLLKEELISINGIGDYTASAIISIGADQVALAIDANIERVFSRIFLLKTLKGKKLQDEIKDKFHAEEFFKHKSIKSYRELNEALMDLGRTICKANSVDCENCTVKKNCLAFIKGRPLELPNIGGKTEKKKAKQSKLHLLRIIVLRESKILVYKKSKKQWLAGQYELPTFVITSEDNKCIQYPLFTGPKINVKNLVSFKSTITRYNIQNSIVEFKLQDFNKSFNLSDYEFIERDCEKTNFAISVDKTLKKYQLI